MRFDQCNLFRRSFTNKGLGFTFNNDRTDEMFEQRKYFDLQARTFFLNRDVKPKLVRSASPEQALSLLIENNIEEVEMFENTKSSTNPEGEINQKPKTILVVLHDPSEPANIRSRSLEVPLGYSSKVYITSEAEAINSITTLILICSSLFCNECYFLWFLYVLADQASNIMQCI